MFSTELLFEVLDVIGVIWYRSSERFERLWKGKG